MKKVIEPRKLKKSYLLFYWIFAVLFLVLGVLNFIYVHAVPGLFYSLLALFYLPKTQDLIIRKTSITLSFWLLIIFGLLILWGTLAVGDLFELFEAWMLH